ncbi:cytochrome P450 [Nocardia panacis]|uniref:Cytochrome P450 n=1 Tax=Nocardia panacis TaxID=2340916 RepID=A0A3A4K9W4_9NOCA|nr:cytochrome P450 [Nocardia panacis]RJO69963.1 cytochrome P450 [Nocardia panacis]
MTETRTVLAALPIRRPTGRPFDPPAELTELCAREPLVRLRFPDGHLGWLATDHATIRTVLAHPDFSNELRRHHQPVLSDAAPLRVPPGEFLNTDPPEHTRFRKLLAGRFTVRRMRQLADRVAEFTTECLDEMARAGGPVDLVTALARPVPELMICTLLGVPQADHDRFRRMNNPAATPAEARANTQARLDELFDYIRALILAKRAHPTDDLLTDLTATDLTDEELVGVGGLLLAAGLDTTANMLALGTFALLSNPDQLASLQADPDLIDGAIEEMLRYLSIAHLLIRTAARDVDIAGAQVKSGETVALSIQAGNRDARRFDNPDELDLRRGAVGHLAFGHGVHQCLGQQLARTEMRVVWRELLARFPGLRLAVPSGDVPLRGVYEIAGVISLPVTW